MSQPESGIPGSVGEDKMGWNSKAGLIDDCQSWLFKVAGDCQTWWNPCSLCNGHQPPTLTGARQFSILWSSRRRSCCPFDLMPPLPLSTVGHINKLLVRLGGEEVNTFNCATPPLHMYTTVWPLPSTRHISTMCWTNKFQNENTFCLFVKTK